MSAYFARLARRASDDAATTHAHEAVHPAPALAFEDIDAVVDAAPEAIAPRAPSEATTTPDAPPPRVQDVAIEHVDVHHDAAPASQVQGAAAVARSTMQSTVPMPSRHSVAARPRAAPRTERVGTLQAHAMPDASPPVARAVTVAPPPTDALPVASARVATDLAQAPDPAFASPAPAPAAPHPAPLAHARIDTHEVRAREAESAPETPRARTAPGPIAPRVQIGRIELEIVGAPPAPAPVPAPAFPAEEATPPAPAFNARRHYLRSV